METKILAFAGSTREDSVNRKLIKEAAEFLRQLGAQVILIELKDFEIPFYNGDLEAKSGMPEKAKQLRRLMIESECILISSPEYNSSLPALLKNVIDWASRSEDGKPSREAFQSKKYFLMSASPSKMGGVRSLAHLRTIIEELAGVGAVAPAQFSVPNAYEAFDEQGHLKDETKQKELQQMLKEVLPTLQARL